MRVLMIEPKQGVGSTSETAVLEAAGHEVVRCADDTGRHACNGMPGGSGCPVDGDGVDVAVVVGSAGDSSLVADRVRCVVRRFVPLVTMGAGGEVVDPATGNAGVLFDGAIPVVHVDGADVLASAVAVAAHSALDRHGELATAELRTVLAHNDVEAPEATVVVRRAIGGLRVELFPTVPLSGQVAQTAAVRVAAALRAYDSSAHGIGVVLAISP
jgi:hypothetical protein